jgi:CBS-domain-containing membrane protein
MRVGDIMTPDFINVRVETKLTRVLQLKLDRRIRSRPVIEDDQRLAGVVSRQDVMSALENCARSDP